MFDTRPVATATPHTIPVLDIAEARRSFPTARIAHEIVIAAAEPLSALSICADAFARAGYILDTLRATGGGRIACRLCDDGMADTDTLEAVFAGPAAPRIESWTIVLTRPTS